VTNHITAVATRAVRVADATQLASVLGTRPPPQVLIDLKELDVSERRHWEHGLNRALGACGCPEGGVAVLLAISACAVAVAVDADGLPEALWGKGLAIVGTILGAALLGKLTGRVRGRRRARRLVGQLIELTTRRQADGAGAP
jgi:hypothetical protein